MKIFNFVLVDSKKTLSLRAVVWSALFLAMPLAAARAQVTYNGSPNTEVSLSSTDTLSRIAVDSGGDLFYFVNNGSSVTLYKRPAGGSPTTLNSAFPYMPTAVAVNSSGTALYMIYFASSAGCNTLTYQRVSMVATTVNATPSDLPQCFSFGSPTPSNLSYSDPVRLAVDTAGNLYVDDYGAANVWRIPGPVSASSIPTAQLVFNVQENEIAIHGSTLYFAAYNFSGSNYVLYKASTSQFSSTIPSGLSSTSSVGNVGNDSDGIAVDSNGNVFIGTPTSIQEYNGTSITTFLSVPHGVTSVGIDSTNLIHYASQDASGAPFIATATAGLLDFGSVNVGSTSSSKSLSFTIGASSSTTVASIHLATMGMDNRDFVDAGGSTCTVKTYATSTDCVVNVKFTPHTPGLRAGAITMVDGSGNVLVSVPFQGTGVGPQVGFAPATQTTIGSSLSAPSGAASDGAGNVYVADTSNNRLLKETLSAGSYTQSTIGSGLSGPTAVAIDGAGNLYVADTGNNRTVKETWNGSSYTQTALVTGLNAPTGVAVDASGNVYIADTGNNQVLKETLNGSSYTQSTVANNLSSPSSVAVDASGNVYVLQSSAGNVLKETVNGSSYTETTAITGLSSPAALAIDPVGNLYIADTANNQVLKEALSAGSFTGKTILNTLSSPAGVAVDGSGNIYIADTGNNRVLKEDVVTAPSLSFASTSVGVQSSDSPQLVTVSNNGNATLTFPLPTSGNNPSISTNYQLAGATTCPQLTTSSGSAGTLAQGATCDYAVSFIPVTGGTDTGSLTLKDNNLNAAGPGYTTQAISLTGTASQFVFTPGTLPNATAGVSYSQSLSVTGGTASYSYSISSGSLPSGLSISPSTGAITGTPASVGTFSFVVTATDANSQTGTQNYSITVSAPTLTLSPASSTSLQGSTYNTYSQQFAASGGTAPYTYSIAVTSGTMPTGLSFNTTTGTLSGTPATAGSVSFSVKATDGTTGTGSPFSVTNNYTLTIAATTTTTTLQSSANPSGYSNSVTFTATVSPSTITSGTVTFTADSSTVCTASLNSSATATCSTAALNAGSHAIVATLPGTADYSTSSGNLSQTVNPAVLNAIADNATRIYGTANPTFIGTVTGAVNGDTFSESFTTSATLSSNVGTYAIVPSVTGANLANYTVTPQNGTLTITQAGSQTSLAVSSTSVNPGQNITLTATVSSVTSGTPTGTVIFYDGSTQLGSVPLSGGTASLSTSALVAGSTNTLTASYGGDVNFTSSSTSASVPVTVSALDFIFTLTGPSIQTVVPGSSVSYQALIDPLYGSYAGPVNFTVTGLPPGATFTISPSTIASSGGKQNVQLTIQTQAVAAMHPAPPLGRKTVPLAFAFLLLPLLGAKRMRRHGKGLRQWICIVILIGGLAAAVSGCGSPNGFFTQAQKSYDVTITATAGGLQHTATVTVELQ